MYFVIVASTFPFSMDIAIQSIYCESLRSFFPGKRRFQILIQDNWSHPSTNLSSFSMFLKLIQYLYNRIYISEKYTKSKIENLLIFHD